jgi:hypothetical protein
MRIVGGIRFIAVITGLIVAHVATSRLLFQGRLVGFSWVGRGGFLSENIGICPHKIDPCPANRFRSIIKWTKRHEVHNTATNSLL